MLIFISLMASAFGHALAAFTIGKGLAFKKQSLKFWITGIVCSILPDADVIAFSLNIPYEHMFGHRGITHSIFFALLLALLLTFTLFRSNSKKLLIGLYLFLTTISHAVLDAMTSGGLGVAFFAPFDNSRYFFPWRGIKVSPIGAEKFFGEWGLKVIKSEAIWIGIPCLIILTIVFLIKKGIKTK